MTEEPRKPGRLSYSNHRRQVRNYYQSRDPDLIFDLDQYSCSEHYSPLYGQLLAEALVRRCRRYRAFRVMEVGAGRGQLAFDVLSHIRARYPDMYGNLRYVIVELSPSLAGYQRRKLRRFGVAVVVGDALCLPIRPGALDRWVVISNELIADLPSPSNSKRRAAGKALAGMLDERCQKPLDTQGYVNQGAVDFIRELDRATGRATALLIEYGLHSTSKIRRLGPPDCCHYEVGINWTFLEGFARAVFPHVRRGSLGELLGLPGRKGAGPPSNAKLAEARRLYHGVKYLSDALEQLGRQPVSPGCVEDALLGRSLKPVQELLADAKRITSFKRYYTRRLSIANRHEEKLACQIARLSAVLESYVGERMARDLGELLLALHRWKLGVEFHDLLHPPPGEENTVEYFQYIELRKP